MSKKVATPYWEQLNQHPTEEDSKNIIVVFDALDLSPQQASDERIWTYATHCLAKKYVAQRWNKIPENDAKAVDYIVAHYFVSGVRGLFRDNAIARLWWMGQIASRCKDYELERVLQILLRPGVADVRANLLERHGLSMSAEVFSGVVRVLGRALDAHGNAGGQENTNPAIYERNTFRSFMKSLNRRGGRIVLNALSREQLDETLDEMAKQAIEQN
ncbi:MAG: DUF6339 family protein [Gammaproteobacteria bacterium]|nr:DUF6339 family protein [Gammaproteobacteria bacterium]